MADFQVKKLSKRAGLKNSDCISQLPETILVQILSFLSMEEAARTSVFSRCWKWLWLFADEFNFDSSRLIPRDFFKYPKHAHTILDVPLLRGRYFEWVDEVFQSYRLHVEKASGINRLRFQFPLRLDGWYVKQVDKWLSFAFEMRVYSLELDLKPLYNPNSFYHDNYCFPYSLVPEIELSCLRSLSFSGVNVFKEDADPILFKFPFLEHLKVCHSCPVSLEIGSSSRVLKHVEITDCRAISVIVRNTCLVSLTLTSVEKLVLQNNPNLLSLCVFEAVPLQVLSSCCLSGLQILTWNLDYCDDKVLDHDPQLCELKQLTLIVASSRKNTHVRLTTLLSLSPKLEKLVVEFVPWSCISVGVVSHIGR